MKKNTLESIDEALKKESSKQRTYLGAEKAKVGRKKGEDKKIAISIYLKKEEHNKLLEAMQDEFEENKSQFARKIILKYLRETKIR